MIFLNEQAITVSTLFFFCLFNSLWRLMYMILVLFYLTSCLMLVLLLVMFSSLFEIWSVDLNGLYIKLDGLSQALTKFGVKW